MNFRTAISVPMLCALAGCAAVPAPDETPAPPVPVADGQLRLPPRIERWLSTCEVDFHALGQQRYALTLTSPKAPTDDQWSNVQLVFRGRVAEAYAKEAGLPPQDVSVALLSERTETYREKRVYRGEAAAFGAADLALSYDPYTRHGKLAMKIRDGDLAKTRDLIKRHIERIVSDRSVRLTAGVRPPAGHYYLLGERVLQPGGVLEIDFRTE